MTGYCNKIPKIDFQGSDPCRPAQAAYGAMEAPASYDGPLAWFEDMIPHCLEYATAAKAEGRPIVGVLCEYTPREMILAAGGVPVCLCGGALEMIGPAENELPANLCPLIKSTYGYHVEKANPFLEMADLLVAETTCDGKKKMYELMSRTREMVVLELPQKPNDPNSFWHWRAELNKLKAELEKRFSVQITDERLRQAIRLMNKERKLRRELAHLMASDAPAITGRQLLDFKSIISGINADLDQYSLALDLFQTQRNPKNAGKVRVLLSGVPTVHGAERVVDLIEQAGGLIVCMENCTGIKPIWDNVDDEADDLLKAIAQKYLNLPCSVMTPNDRRLDLLSDMRELFRPDCIVDLSWQACLTYDVESWRVKRWAEQNDNLPYLRISTDYSPSDSARISMRLEALFETVRSRQCPGNAGVSPAAMPTIEADK
jgi:benzoyl-CoA reductase/2-hydroxyglutaryl-CoA dehydratase subunit BcrC/BadD/HgdB